ncbi:venom acid phosphatase Acph-1 [Apis florea]|uniref:venom acid phosphatase Acph-1 n=1 Tax=Apis florea TaxID=7463 RepID=UPI0006296D72|nr:venom acid phosphatase Acph-1 [Apis florea]XP_012345677.1 venom acid phosphatase Acph-1 [Apis florea]XP_012345678.1 venom acid phosphatase Acph-1 [Apis florea]XP_031774347.1 venom acid phosphatase Acph-1 [Apis florea]
MGTMMASCIVLKKFSSMSVIAILAMVVGVQAELKQINVIFRHGDRIPDEKNEMYPKDPYLYYDFYPLQRGELTNSGKMREYQLGQFLRERYGDFLGDIYTEESVSALSSFYDRTKISLQLVLAALYPPNKLQQWNEDLNWQPIATKYLRRYEDNIFLPEDCLLFTIEFERVLESPRGKYEFSKYDKLKKKLEEWTGKNITTPWDYYYIYHTLMAEQSYGLTLPSWTNNIFPRGELFDATVFAYNITNSTPLLKKLYGGPLLRIFTKHMLDVVSGTQKKKRKIYLFSGHESNIAAVLHALELYYPHVPEYSSSIIVELHNIEGTHYVKIVYYLGIPCEAKELRLPGCEVLCPLYKYLQLIENVIPSNEEMICDKRFTDTLANNLSIEELDFVKLNLIRIAGSENK